MTREPIDTTWVEKFKAEIEYYRGQNDLLVAQKKEDAAKISELQEQVDRLTSKMRLHIENTVSIAKELQISEYAPARKVATTPAPLPPVKLPPDLENEIKAEVLKLKAK